MTTAYYYLKAGIASLLLLSSVIQTRAQQIDMFTGTQTGYHAYTMLFQNNYGQRLTQFTVEGRHSFGITFGTIYNKHHMIRYGVNQINASQTFYDDVFRKEMQLQYMSLPIIYSLLIDPGHNEKVKFFISGGLAVNILTQADLNHYIRGKKTSMYKYATINPFDTYPWTNPNQAEIERLLSGQLDLYPDHKEMFRNVDISAILSFGFQRTMNKDWQLLTEFTTMVSIRDIHANGWNLPRGHGDQKNSYHLFGGINISVIYFLR
jgi:hypothetical protein